MSFALVIFNGKRLFCDGETIQVYAKFYVKDIEGVIRYLLHEKMGRSILRHLLKIKNNRGKIRCMYKTMHIDENAETETEAFKGLVKYYKKHPYEFLDDMDDTKKESHSFAIVNEDETLFQILYQKGFITGKDYRYDIEIESDIEYDSDI